MLSSGVRVQLASLDEALAFTARHYARIFGSDPADDRFYAEALTPAKLRFLAVSDRFSFWENEEPIGLLMGNPIDWSTYYWRTVAFLPEHQGRGLLAAVLEHTDRVMRDAGIVRVEGETSPNNYRQMRLLLRLGYQVTGSVNSERWGTLLRLTKYLDEAAEEKFARQFCKDVRFAKGGINRRDLEGGSHEEVRYVHDLRSMSSSLPSSELRSSVGVGGLP
ncbi:MAG TPA: GNAT family N-acetyltransferase [Sandaracinaceae bacterium]